MRELTPSPDHIGQQMELAWRQRERERAQVRAAVTALDPGLRRDEVELLRAYLDWREGRTDRALDRASQVTGRRSPPDVWLARALSLRGCVLAELGDLPGASAALEAQVQLSRQLGARSEEATGVHDLGILHLDRDPQRARPYLERAHSLAKASGDAELLAFASHNLGLLSLRADDIGAARAAFQEALSLARAHGIRLVEAGALSQLGALALQEGRRAEAERLLRLALERSHPHDPLPEDIIMPLTALLLDGDRPQEARRLLLTRLRAARAAQARPLQMLLHGALAEVHERRGDPLRALSHLKASLKLFREIHAESQERQVRALEVLHRTQHAERAAAEAQARSRALSVEVEQLSQLHQQAQQLSLTDELTGSWNRRFLLTRGSQLAAEATAARPLALAVLDLDHFKRINDSYGHEQGDSVLREFADLLREELPPEGVVVRSGGEEFVVLLPLTGTDAACGLLEALRARLKAHRWRRLPPEERVTFTAGVSTCDNGQLLDALRRADRLLYDGKAAGRDRVRSLTAQP